ncbi:hypothetical protein F4680DRAFT_436689 [Xylaria scruposa]|nr:hypothetical protein F4680DRAFT_436689 [Xylaria scruposa]
MPVQLPRISGKKKQSLGRYKSTQPTPTTHTPRPHHTRTMSNNTNEKREDWPSVEFTNVAKAIADLSEAISNQAKDSDSKDVQKSESSQADIDRAIADVQRRLNAMTSSPLNNQNPMPPAARSLLPPSATRLQEIRSRHVTNQLHKQVLAMIHDGNEDMDCLHKRVKAFVKVHDPDHPFLNWEPSDDNTADGSTTLGLGQRIADLASGPVHDDERMALEEIEADAVVEEEDENEEQMDVD